MGIRQIFKAFCFGFAVICSLAALTYGYLNKDQIVKVCFGNKDLPDLKNAKILRWSDPLTWGGTIPKSGAYVVVPADKTILLDISPPNLKTLEIAGVLIFSDDNIKLSVKNILLTGVLQIGSPEKFYTHQAEINLIGKDSRFLLQGGRLALFGIKDVDQRSPASMYTHWGFANFKNIILKKDENSEL